MSGSRLGVRGKPKCVVGMTVCTRSSSTEGSPVTECAQNRLVRPDVLVELV